MKRIRNDCEKENDSSVAEVPSSKRRRACPSILGEIAQFSIKPDQEEEEFVLGRRKDPPLLKDDEGRDINAELCEEVVLGVFQWLDKGTLGRCARVCRQWNRLTQDESLWKRLDLGSKALPLHVLSLLSARGLLALRLTKASILPTPLNPPKNPFRVQYLDLSMSEYSLPSLVSFLSHTRDLRKVAMEKCSINEEICALLSKNTNLTVLHLAMVQGLNLEGLTLILNSCKALEELNISWTDLSEEAIASMCQNIPSSLKRLNIAGCKDYLQDKHLLQLMRNAPNLKDLDISDAGSVSEETIDSILLHLKKLEHLGVSRCYGISPNSYIYLSVLTSLKYLTVFGTMKDAAIQELRLHLPGIHINKYMFSTIARPTVGIRKTSIWNVRVRD